MMWTFREGTRSTVNNEVTRMPRKGSGQVKRRTLDPTAVFTASLAHALCHPLRVEILQALMHGPTSASKIAQALGEETSHVSYHLRNVLGDECGLVEMVAQRRVRGAVESDFRIRRDAFLNEINWHTLPPPAREGLRAISLQSFLDVCIPAVVDGMIDSRPDSTFAWRSITTDAKGWGEVQDAMSGLEKTVDIATEESRRRLKGATGSAGIPTIIGFAAFEATAGAGQRKQTS
jgi:DNA-binding transcriptional ArsR family regulator